jgi:hypothetical protein
MERLYLIKIGPLEIKTPESSRLQLKETHRRALDLDHLQPLPSSAPCAYQDQRVSAAGGRALRASLQIITIFGKFQSYKTIPHPWLGVSSDIYIEIFCADKLQLINQFSVGITVLYCLWATPPQSRTDAYNWKNILEAVRGCSNNLVIIAERWERAKDLLDVFELLATEDPLVEIISSSDNGPQRAINRVRDAIADEI